MQLKQEPPHARDYLHADTRHCLHREAMRPRLHFDVLELQQYYHLPLKEAARELGICEAALKRICRRNRIKKWPYRQVQSVLKRIEVEVHMRKKRRERQQARSDLAFLLPHELDHRRKHSADVRDEDDMLRLHQLHLEMYEIIEKAHAPDEEFVEGKVDKPHDLTRDSPPSVVMADAIDVDGTGRPLDVLATLCATEISRRDDQEKNVEVASMEILECKTKSEPTTSA